jgi:hypothetical protein
MCKWGTMFANGDFAPSVGCIVFKRGIFVLGWQYIRIAMYVSASIKQFLTRKSSGGHQAKRRKEDKTEARGTGRHPTASALPMLGSILHPKTKRAEPLYSLLVPSVELVINAHPFAAAALLTASLSLEGVDPITGLCPAYDYSHAAGTPISLSSMRRHEANHETRKAATMHRLCPLLPILLLPVLGCRCQETANTKVVTPQLALLAFKASLPENCTALGCADGPVFRLWERERALCEWGETVPGLAGVHGVKHCDGETGSALTQTPTQL